MKRINTNGLAGRVEVMVDPRVSPAPLPTRPASFPFLTNLKLNHVNIENYGKDVFRYKTATCSLCK